MTFLPAVVLHRLVRHPLALAPLLVRRASVLERRLKCWWKSNDRVIRRQHIYLWTKHKFAAWGDKANKGRIGRMAPARGLSRKKISNWGLNQLTSQRRVAVLSLPTLGRCYSTTLSSYVPGEKILGIFPFPRYALHSMIVVCELYLINCIE